MHPFFSVVLSALLLLTLAVPVAAAPPSPQIDTVAGTGAAGFSGDGGPAARAQLSNAEGVAVAPDGTIVIADTYNNRIRTVDRRGVIRTVAGTGQAGYTGDGGPATAAQLRLPFGVSVQPDGTIVVADTYNSAVRLIERDGTIRTLAGTGQAGSAGDGGPAIAAQLRFPFGVSTAPDGAVLIADTFNHRVRAVDVDGEITTVAGTGSRGFSGDGNAAQAAQLALPYDVAHRPGGGFVIADTSNNRIRAVTRDGTITTLAGTGVRGYAGDGSPAAGAVLGGPHGVAVDRSGLIIVADTFNDRVRVIDRDGAIRTLAGTARPATAATADPPPTPSCGSAAASRPGRPGRSSSPTPTTRGCVASADRSDATVLTASGRQEPARRLRSSARQPAIRAPPERRATLTTAASNRSRQRPWAPARRHRRRSKSASTSPASPPGSTRSSRRR